ncbi:uncharacterized protein BYT42DRAFT_613005 [Radiomyces spectabilis]|uniref:uncharacterized protein n=1 Tax=Radiomyces spectabilis TaxID=64574 RepID=UPI00221EC322|nr:uncharacterized protein BYT42DRAFT_613005 [Radiomyces spectabilis]KAI8381204.1 hypothetical protein BYT42DRAFT_613005 [Radiomyces spectabilis]
MTSVNANGADSTSSIFDDELIFSITSHSTTSLAMHPMNLTPCSGLSRLSIGSQSNTHSRTRHMSYQRPRVSFNDRLMKAIREEAPDHPNLTMVLGQDKISFDQFDSFKEDESPISQPEMEEESDEEDIRSFSSGPMSLSPDRFWTRGSLFDDQHNTDDIDGLNESSKSHTMELSPKDIFDDSETSNSSQPTSVDSHYDPSRSWITQIYEDSSSDSEEMIPSKEQENKENIEADNNDDDGADEENRPPRVFGKREHRASPVRIRYTKRHANRTCPPTSSTTERDPLQELPIEEYISDEAKREESPRKKLFIEKGGQITAAPQKIRFMRSLSPTRKGKEQAQSST